MINKVYNNIKYYFVIIFFIPFAAPAQTPDIKPPLMNSDGAACAIHIEKDYNIKRRLARLIHDACWMSPRSGFPGLAAGF